MYCAAVAAVFGTRITLCYNLKCLFCVVCLQCCFSLSPSCVSVFCAVREDSSIFTLKSQEYVSHIKFPNEGKKRGRHIQSNTVNKKSFSCIPIKPPWIKVETYSIPHFLFPYYLLQIWEYSTQCVLGTDIWNKFIILSGFHPCINKSMKILSEHILMCANSA